jgi:hypothetical protein
MILDVTERDFSSRHSEDSNHGAHAGYRSTRQREHGSQAARRSYVIDIRGREGEQVGETWMPSMNHHHSVDVTQFAVRIGGNIVRNQSYGTWAMDQT